MKAEDGGGTEESGGKKESRFFLRFPLLFRPLRLWTQFLDRCELHPEPTAYLIASMGLSRMARNAG